MELNVKSKRKALHNFFEAYSQDVEGTMLEMDRVQLLEYLGRYEGGDISDPKSYSANDIFVGVAAAATGIEEDEFLLFAVKFFDV